MALSFASGQYVNAGSAASLDNLHYGSMTAWAWVYRTSDAANQTVVAKFAAYPAGSWLFSVDNYTIAGQLRMLVIRGSLGAGWETGWVDAVSSTSDTIPMNTWTFVAGTVTASGGTSTPRLYIGSMTALAAEPAYAAQLANPTTALNDDATYDCYVGNAPINTANVFLGRLARTGVVNRALTLDELKAIQFGTIPQANVSGSVLLFDLHGTSTQPDHSGAGNSGTITGSPTMVDHAPLVSPFGPDEWSVVWLPITGQYARPVSTTSAGLWTPVGAATIHEALDEASPNDADYAQSPLSPAAASPVRVALGPLNEPPVSTGHIVRYRMGKDAAGGDTLTVTPRLYQGATLISTGPAQAVPDAFQTFSWTLTGPETDSISNYGDLRVDISAITT